MSGGKGGGSGSQPAIQIFGTERNQATRAALRFFKERRVAISFVDLRKRSIAPGELRRFAERLGAPALLDTDSRAYRDGGLAYLVTDEAGILSRILADDSLIRLPLVRRANDVTAGPSEAIWSAWLRSEDGP